jgi:AGZA family xanthine/uracil permease-like MFS transporter
MDKLGDQGVLYHGLAVLGGGATLAGIVLASITVFIIERDFIKASYFAVAGAVFTFFGLIHAEALGVGQTPSMVVSYIGIAVVLFACSKYASVSPRADEAEAMHGHGAAPKPAE